MYLNRMRLAILLESSIKYFLMSIRCMVCNYTMIHHRIICFFKHILLLLVKIKFDLDSKYSIEQALSIFKEIILVARFIYY